MWQLKGWIEFGWLNFRVLEVGFGEVREERKKKMRRMREVKIMRKRDLGVVSFMGRSFFQAFAMENCFPDFPGKYFLR